MQTSFTEPPNSTSVESKGAEGVNIPIVKIPPLPTPPPRTCWAEALLRTVEHGQVSLDRYGVVAQRQVDGLVVVVVGAGQGHGVEEVKADLVVGLGVLDGLALRRWLQLTVVRTCKQANIPVWSGPASKHSSVVQTCKQASIPVWSRPASKQAFHCGPDLQAFQCNPDLQASKISSVVWIGKQASIPVWSGPASKYASVVRTYKQACVPVIEEQVTTQEQWCIL